MEREGIPLRILIADGDTRLCSAIKMLLRQEPGPVRVQATPDLEGLRAHLRSWAPDLLLLDWNLPGRPRLAALQESSPRSRWPKVIVLDKPSGSRTAALEAGADAFISKDESPLRLLETVRRLRAELECEGR